MISLVPLKHPVDTDVKIPGSLSYTIRALILASLVAGDVKIYNPLTSDDVDSLIGSLETLGIQINKTHDELLVRGDISQIKNYKHTINVGLSGRTARMLLPILCVVPGQKIVTCQPAFKKRPIGSLVEVLRALGAKIEYLEDNGHLPLKISSTNLNSGTSKISGKVSSQYISALLLVAPLIGGLEIDIIDKQSSKPFIDVTIDVMRTFGVSVSNKRYRKYQVNRKSYINPKTYVVEPDATAASYFFAIAAITESTIRVHLSPYTKQGDVKFVDLLARMGCRTEKNKEAGWIKVEGPRKLRSIDVDMNQLPDVVQTLAVTAAFARGTTHIRGIAHLAYKETNRIKATCSELQKMGIKVSSTPDSLIIEGGHPYGAVIDTHGDHRMALAFSVAGAKITGVKVQNHEVVSKSFPEFWKVLKAIGVNTDKKAHQNIVLVGMRGAGKSTIAKLLGKRLGKRVVSTDHEVTQKTGQSIPQLVAHRGWTYFRAREREAVEKLAKNIDTIISTGGGVIIDPKNIAELKKNGVVVYLRAREQTLIRRIGSGTKRPPLTNHTSPEAEIRTVLAQRSNLYEKAADIIIDTDMHNQSEIADIIKSKLNTIQ